MKKFYKDDMFKQSKRPEVSLITNHGYGGPDFPTGGAPDTGGQNVYVNTLAMKLESLGYKVTIFARGGFPHYGNKLIRSAPEYLSDFVRYIYIPGGGNEFIRKEDIAIALDEEFEWLYRFINKEAKAKKCEPWEVYQFINSHYWDAAVLGVRLIEHWRNDIAAQSMTRLMEGVVSAKTINKMCDERHWKSLGEAPAFYLGWLLLNQEEFKNLPIKQQVRNAASCWVAAKRISINEENYLVDSTEEILSRLDESFEPTLKKLMISAVFGQAILKISPDIDEQKFKRNLAQINIHVWTPHSLGELKDFNFRFHTTETRRQLKFCERRSHERMVCDRTRVFVATSAKIAEYLWTHFRVPIEQTFFFPPCIDEMIFRPYDKKELVNTYRYLSKISGISEVQLKAGKIIFETSRMDQTKRKDLLLTTFAKILPDYDDLYLFIGGGPENKVFQLLNKQLQNTGILNGRAFLTGAIPDEHIGPMFSVADIYATASEMEGFGMCVSQAAAAGTPIVSSDIIPFCQNYVPEYVEMFPFGDANAFASALRRLLNDKDKMEKNSMHLREKARVLKWEPKTIEFLEYLRQKGIEITKNKKVK